MSFVAGQQDADEDADEEEEAEAPEDAEEAPAEAEECVATVVEPFDPTTMTFGEYVSTVAQSDAVGGKNCNHGGAVSEAVHAAQVLAKEAREAAKAERAAERAAAKAERDAAKAAAKTEREAGQGRQVEQGQARRLIARHRTEPLDGPGTRRGRRRYQRLARYAASRCTPMRFADPLLCCQSAPIMVSPGTSVTPRTWRGTPNSSSTGKSSQP